MVVVKAQRREKKEGSDGGREGGREDGNGRAREVRRQSGTLREVNAKREETEERNAREAR